MYTGGVHKPVRGEHVTQSLSSTAAAFDGPSRCDAFKSCSSGGTGSGAGCRGGGEDLDGGAQARGPEILAVRYCPPEVRTGAKSDLEMELLRSKPDLLTLTCLMTTSDLVERILLLSGLFSSME